MQLQCEGAGRSDALAKLEVKWGFVAAAAVGCWPVQRDPGRFEGINPFGETLLPSLERTVG